MLPNFLKPYDTALSNLIRLGRKSDGGYVIDKRVISKTKAIITCGLEAEWSFEKQFQAVSYTHLTLPTIYSV